MTGDHDGVTVVNPMGTRSKGLVRSALPQVPLDEIGLLVIEDVGNLVCPAEWLERMAAA